MRKKKAGLLLAGLSLLMVLCAIFGLFLGSAELTWGDCLDALTGKLTQEDTVFLIVFRLRLPRVLAALLAGAGLAVAGLLLQSAVNNILCSPNVIGVNAGAGFAVMIFLCLFPMAFQWLPVAAFAGALGTTALVLGISFAFGSSSGKTTVVLAGVATGALLNAGISFLSQLFPEVLSSYASFSAGGFSGIYSEDLPVPAIMILAGILCAQCIAPRMNLLCLGDELAQTLGVRVRALRFFALVLASLLCAAVVSFAGLLGFVGLIVPHVCRRIVQSEDMRLLVPACTLSGAALTVVADLAGRTLFSPAELPAGILLAMLGAPFFLFLLFRRRGNYDSM